MGFLRRALECCAHARKSAQVHLEAHGDALAPALITSLSVTVAAGLDYWSGRLGHLPMTIISGVSWLFMLGLPVVLVRSHRRRQQHVITKVRALYAVAEEHLEQQRDQQARRALASIRRWERHWRIGDSLIYRIAYAAHVIAATSLCAVLFFVAHANLYSKSGHGHVAHTSLADTVRYLLEHPTQLWIIGVLSLLFGLRAVEHLKDLAGAPWSEFYGDRIEAALKAGRTLSQAPWHDRRLPQASISARELLGLPETFTSAQLRRAWLKLARELHPDRWSTAGEGVRQIKETALKRVNAARDELASQVSD